MSGLFCFMAHIRRGGHRFPATTKRSLAMSGLVCYKHKGEDCYIQERQITHIAGNKVKGAINLSPSISIRISDLSSGQYVISA